MTHPTMSKADILRIELALARSVYCDDCDWHGATGQCVNTGGWLSCPKCRGQQIYETHRRTLH